MVDGLDRTIATLQANRATALALLLAMAETEADSARRDDTVDTDSWHSDVTRTFVRSTALEVGATTRTHDRAIENQMHSAVTVIQTLPFAAEAWQKGRISSSHVRVIEEIGSSIDNAERRSEFDRRITEVALESTVARTRRRALQLTASLDPDGIEDAHRFQAERRRVDLQHLGAGMSLLSAYLPSVMARAAYDRLTRLARSIRSNGSGGDLDDVERSPASSRDAVPACSSPAGSDASGRRSTGIGPDDLEDSGSAATAPDSRSFDARRADALTDLLLAGDVAASSPNSAINAIRPHVSVTIPELTLLGSGADPAWLDG